METFSPEQNLQLKSWAEERDSILFNISTLKTEYEDLSSKNKFLSDSNTEIETKINKSIGRLEELDKKEKEYEDVLSSKVSTLESNKTRLETEVTNLQKNISLLISNKEELTKDVLVLMQVQNEVFSRTGIIEKIVEHVTRVSSENVSTINNIVESLTAKVKELLSLSDINIRQHNEILNEIPRLFVELRRKSLERPIINKQK